MTATSHASHVMTAYKMSGSAQAVTDTMVSSLRQRHDNPGSFPREHVDPHGRGLGQRAIFIGMPLETHSVYDSREPALWVSFIGRGQRWSWRIRRGRYNICSARCAERSSWCGNSRPHLPVMPEEESLKKAVHLCCRTTSSTGVGIPWGGPPGPCRSSWARVGTARYIYRNALGDSFRV